MSRRHSRRLYFFRSPAGSLGILGRFRPLGAATARYLWPRLASSLPRAGRHQHPKIASTVRYTALAPDRFKDFWKD
jgi:hypothetical protein